MGTSEDFSGVPCPSRIMAFGDSDLDTFISDFAVPVVYGATMTRGILSTSDEGNPFPEADNSSIGRWVRLLVKTGALPGLSQDTPITIDGDTYYVNSYDRVNDGAFTKVYCQAVPAELQASFPSTTLYPALTLFPAA